LINLNVEVFAKIPPRTEIKEQGSGRWRSYHMYREKASTNWGQPSWRRAL